MGSRDVRILASANEEVEQAAAWLSARSESAMRSFIAGCEEKLRLLASGLVEYPLSHLPELARLGYRACSFGSYILLYFVEDGTAVIAHVFHQHRNYARLVGPKEESTTKE